MPLRGQRTRQGRSSPSSLAALSAAAADVAAVRWKQHKELSTWRLVKEREKKRGSARGWLGIQGNLTAGSRHSYFQVKLSPL